MRIIDIDRQIPLYLINKKNWLLLGNLLRLEVGTSLFKSTRFNFNQLSWFYDEVFYASQVSFYLILAQSQISSHIPNQRHVPLGLSQISLPNLIQITSAGSGPNQECRILYVLFLVLNPRLYISGQVQLRILSFYKFFLLERRVNVIFTPILRFSS